MKNIESGFSDIFKNLENEMNKTAANINNIDYEDDVATLNPDEDWGMIFYFMENTIYAYIAQSLKACVVYNCYELYLHFSKFLVKYNEDLISIDTFIARLMKRVRSLGVSMVYGATIRQVVSDVRANKLYDSSINDICIASRKKTPGFYFYMFDESLKYIVTCQN